MKNQKQNSNLFNGNMQKIKMSSKKHLNTIEECPESEDIIKKIENLDFSTGKSFETPFISLSKTRDKIINRINNLNKSISYPDFFIENCDEIPSDVKSIKEEDINDSNYLEVFSKYFEGNKEKSVEQKGNNNISKLILNEKINRIYLIFQKCNLNKNCLDKMNKFISYFSNVNLNLNQPIDLFFDVISELLSKIQEEYSIKNDLINKLNSISIKKENYEKQIYAIKNELQDKEKELKKLIDNETIGNIDNKIENNNSQQVLLSIINNAKKENQFLLEKILGYKNNVKKILSNFKILFEKHKSCLIEIEKLKSKNNRDFSLVKADNFGIKGKTNFRKMKSHASFNGIHTNQEHINNINNTNMIFQITSLANNLIRLLVDVNRKLFKCDFNLYKIQKNNKIPLNDINELNPIIDINFLLQEKNFQLFSKYISCNLDVINNKIINLPNFFMLNNNRLNKENKNSSVIVKNSNELVKNSSISKINQKLKFFSPDNKSGSKTMKNFINMRKTRNTIRNQKLIRNSTSRDGLSFMNFYNNNDLDSFSFFKKDTLNKVNNKIVNKTVNLEKQRNKKHS